MKYTQEQLNEAIKIAEEHGFRVSEAKKPTQEEINEAIKVAQAYGIRVLKEDGEEIPPVEPEVETPAPAETGAEDDGELITIQVTKAEFEAIKSIIDKVEYENDGSADAEQTSAVIDALDNDNVYTAVSQA